MSAKIRRMVETPVERLVLRMAGPSIAIMLISAMYNMADTYFVGSLGTTAIAAVGVSFSLMAVIQAVGFFFGQGGGNYISRELGAKRTWNAEMMASTAFFSSLLAGLCIGLLGLALLRPLALLLGSTETILPNACEYLTFILVGAPWMSASFTLNNLLRYQGSPFYGMIGMSAGAILNIILDPVFIFVFKMGVSGAGLATMISQMVGLCLLLIGSARSDTIAIRLRHFTPTLAKYRQIFRDGFPSLCRQSLVSVATLALNNMAGGFGDAAIAAMSIVQRVGMLVNAALLGFGQGFQPVCGFNYGAGCYDRVKKAFWFCNKLGCALLAVLGAIVFIYAPEIIMVFREDDLDVIAVGTLALRLQSVAYPLVAWIILNNMLLQTIGRAARASIMAFARQGLFLLPLLFILTPHLGILGIQLSQPLADVATFILSLPLGLGVLRQMPSVRLSQPPQPLPDTILDGKGNLTAGEL